MKHALIKWGLLASVVLAIAGCGGGGSSDTAPTPTPVTPEATTKDKLAAAAALAANDSATNTSSAFTTVQTAGVTAVTTGATTTVNFTVYSDGAVLQNLKLDTKAANNVRVAFAKLVPAANGNADQWVSYVTRVKASGTSKGPHGEAAAMASAVQATTDPYQTDATKLAAQLVYNADGYYTYTFNTAFTVADADRSLTHRLALQLSYTNKAGAVVKVNPYVDFTFDASGKSVITTDPTKTRKMTDVSSCNTCHEKLALHGGGRVDTQYCVMCHNPGTTDPVSGNVVTLSNMAHKIHAGKMLAAAGQPYSIGNQDFSEVGFPQDLRNCSKCHSAANAATPQGDNWKTVTTKEACLSCHANKVGSAFETYHTTIAPTVLKAAGKTAADLSNADCAACHKVGSNISPERVHWNQNEENAAKYKMVIDSATYDATSRKVTVKYYLADPTNNNAAYNLVTSECTGTTTITCANTTKFGNLRLYVAYGNLVGQSTAVTEFTSYNNGGSGANAYAYKGTNDGSNHYTVDIVLPADTATAVAAGTARVVSIGQIKEAKLQVKAATDPRPEVTPKVLQNVIVQNGFKELALTGTLQPRRTIVATEKCNTCHGALGTTSGSNTLAEAFHGGARDTVEACVVCHDANRSSSGNMMTNGLALYEPYQFKRMIHGIHGNSKRTSPFTHGNKVVGAFNKDGTSKTAGNPALATTVENYAAEVAWPGVGINCNACHVNNSYKQDLGPIGTLANKVPSTETDPNKWLVISPKAASCTACHDSSTAIAHVTSFGGSSFGNLTQGAINSLARETCDDCHAPGGFKGVDVVHGQK